MKDGKRWLVLGADEGLAPAAVRYLRENQQQVIPVGDLTALTNPIKFMKHAVVPIPIDYIINNLNYKLLNDNDTDIDAAVLITTTILKTLVPMLNKDSDGVIINLPPQLCLATLTDPTTCSYLLNQMDHFLTSLKYELQMLDCPVHFIEPGERFM